MAARQRRSAWRRLGLGRAWGRRCQAGGASQVELSVLLQAQPHALVQQMQAAHRALTWAAHAEDVPLAWRTTFEGEVYGALHLGRGATAALLLVPPWQLAANVPQQPLAAARVTARLLRLRGWLVVAVDVAAWLQLPQDEMGRQLGELAARVPRLVRRVRAAQSGRRRAAGKAMKRHVRSSRSSRRAGRGRRGGGGGTRRSATWRRAFSVAVREVRGRARAVQVQGKRRGKGAAG